MRPAAKRLSVVLISLALYTAAAIVFFALIIPAYREIQQLRGENKSLDTALANEKQAIEAASRQLSQSQSLGDLQNNLSLALPLEEDVPGIVNQLQGIAFGSGITIDSLSISQLSVKASKNEVVEPVGTLQVALRLRGNYEAMKTYLASLESNIRVIDVDSLAVGGGASKDSSLSYNLVVNTYYQR